MKTCFDLSKIGVKYNCCNSCHEDWEEYGYEMSWRTIGEYDYHVCCNAPSEEEIKKADQKTD